MRIQVRAGEKAGNVLRTAAERRLRFALGRFERRIASIDVRFGDVNGPRGGVDQACRVAVRLAAPAGQIVIEDMDRDAHAALARAADRMARAVGRAVDLARRGRHRTPMALREVRS